MLRAAPARKPSGEPLTPILRPDARRATPFEGGPSFILGNRLYRAMWQTAWWSLASWTRAFMHVWRRLVLRLFGARIARGAHVYPSVRIRDPCNLTMDAHSCPGSPVDRYSMAPITPGDQAIVSQDAILCAGSHAIDDAEFRLTAKPSVVGGYAWVAAGAFVGPGISSPKRPRDSESSSRVRPLEGASAAMGASLITIVVPTRNEERHVPRLLQNLKGLDSRVFVVDSFSTDKTAVLARARGAQVVQHSFVNYALQFQWALDNLPIETDWIMRLDADETLTPELVEEIRRRLPELPPDVTGVNLKRRHIFLGRWIKHGGRYPLTLLRIWRKGAARIEQRWMDEHMVLLHGRAVTFEGDFSDHNLNELTFFTEKHNKYATREAIDVLMRRYGLGGADEALTRETASRQAAAKRWIKERIYNCLPFWLGPTSYFLYRYFIRLGFLDGREGLIYHFLQGCWYRFLVGAKVLEFDRTLKPLADPRDRLAALARLTGYALADLERRP